MMTALVAESDYEDDANMEGEDAVGRDVGDDVTTDHDGGDGDGGSGAAHND